MEPRLNFLLESTSIHGLKHLTGETVDWSKYFKCIFWIVCMLLSLGLMIRTLQNAFEKLNVSTVITADTAYRHFVNVFPGISLCLGKGRTTMAIKDLLGPEYVQTNGDRVRLTLRHYTAMNNYLFLNFLRPSEGIYVKLCSDLNETCGIDLKTFRNAFMPDTCSDVIGKMYFLGREVNCEDYFERFETEAGLCFVANSLYSKGIGNETNLEDFSSLKMRYSNTDNVERPVEIHYKKSYQFMYRLVIHTPEELPDGHQPPFGSIGLRKLGSLLYIALKTTEFHSDPDVKYKSLESRNCRFPFERLDTLSLPFSLNYCRYLKRISMEMKTCNCTLPILLERHDFRTCGVSEFECLNNLTLRVSKDMKNRAKLMDMIGEYVVPTCISMEIMKIGEYERRLDSADTGAVKIEIVNSPTLRYIRKVPFTRLDVIVQVGGIIGLFFGASFLSVLEIIYLICRTIRLKDA